MSRPDTDIIAIAEMYSGIVRDALYWLTLLNQGIAKPGDASSFLDSMPDRLLPTKEQLEIVERLKN